MTAPAAASAPPVPGASWRAWLAWGFGALFFGYAFVQRVAPSVMVEELMRDFAVGGAVLGNLSAVYFYAYAGLQVPVGMLVDRVGPRRLMTWAAVLAAFGSFVFAASGGVAIASLGRLMVGAGAAVSWIGTLVMVTRLFPPARFALLAGVAQAVGMAGAVFGQAPLGAAVAAVGWRPTMTALAAAGLLLAAGLWASSGAAAGATPTARPGLARNLRKVMGNRQTWLAAGVGMALTAPMLGFAGLWAVPFIGGRYGIERPLAAAVSSLIFIGWGVAAPLIGWVSDRMARRRRPLIAGGAILTLSTAAIIYLPGLPLAAAALLLFIAGAAGSSMILAYAVVKEHNDPEASGAAYGLVNTAVVGSGALFQPLIGWLLDLGWTGVTDAGARVYSMADYESALAVLPAAGLFGIAAAWSLREGILPAPRTSGREEC